MELREKIARTVAADLGLQDSMREEPFPLDDTLTLAYLDQGEVDFGKLADSILSIPEIADALKLQIVHTASRMEDLPTERVGEIMREISASQRSAGSPNQSER